MCCEQQRACVLQSFPLNARWSNMETVTDRRMPTLGCTACD